MMPLLTYSDRGVLLRPSVHTSLRYSQAPTKQALTLFRTGQVTVDTKILSTVYRPVAE